MATATLPTERVVVVQGRAMRVEDSTDPRYVAVLIGSRGARYGAWRAPELASGRYYLNNMRTGRGLLDGWAPVVVALGEE